MSEQTKLLIVDDDEDLSSQLKWGLIDDYQILLADSRPRALEIARKEQPEAVTLDLGLPPEANNVSEGMNALGQLLEAVQGVKVVVITGQDEKKHALAAIQQGAYDFLAKPVEIEELKVILKRAVYLRRLEVEHRKLRKHFREDSFQGMLGSSPQMQQVFTAIRKVAASTAPVLIVGESGTGKELAARAIHNLSGRSNGAFVPINCGAIPENLLESELFGHEKGAFTGAHAQKKGQIETARGGSLFLDEVGELPSHLQVKLLRFLQEGVIQRVGGRKEIAVDVRVISATNADLEAMMGEGSFRDDLYYRLAVIVIPLPNLQKREGEILPLAKSFLDRYADENAKKIKGFSAKAVAAMETHAWPGNVRELENRVRRAVIMADKANITPDDLGLEGGHAKYEGLSLKAAREALEKDMVDRALARNQGNVSRAAADLEISRPTLYELMDKLNVERP
ncbi:MAG TPA: PEP-CTERM-box response regulator transcription factor [Acidobacteriota bacterium]|nr:PEP-CTERM-box response regulator transcription factor [Acidobacteriota bacterium]